MRKAIPIGHTADGTPIHAYNKDGKPCCGAKTRWNKYKGPKPDDWVAPLCQRTIVASNGRCVAPGHGGSCAKPKSEVVAIRTREGLHKAMMGIDNDEDRIRELVDKLLHLARSGHFESAKYVIDHVFGTAKQTVENIIADKDALSKIITVTARHLTGEAFEKWLAEVEAEMDSKSPI